MATPAVLQQVDLGDAYEILYNALGRAYWDASDVPSKDLIHGAQEAVGEIITTIDEQQLTNQGTLFAQLGPKIEATNAALKTIQTEISNITKNITTATTVGTAIAKVLSLFPV